MTSTSCEMPTSSDIVVHREKHAYEPMLTHSIAHTRVTQALLTAFVHACDRTMQRETRKVTVQCYKCHGQSHTHIRYSSISATYKMDINGQGRQGHVDVDIDVPHEEVSRLAGDALCNSAASAHTLDKSAAESRVPSRVL
jgi:hypothetical protein